MAHSHRTSCKSLRPLEILPSFFLAERLPILTAGGQTLCFHLVAASHAHGQTCELELAILRAGSGSGRAKKSPVFFLAARARPDPTRWPGRKIEPAPDPTASRFGSGRAGPM